MGKQNRNEDQFQAFPVAACNGHTPGMTMREWYAGMALSGLCANPKLCTMTKEIMSERALVCADAMIAMFEKEL